MRKQTETQNLFQIPYLLAAAFYRIYAIRYLLMMSQLLTGGLPAGCMLYLFIDTGSGILKSRPEIGKKHPNGNFLSAAWGAAAIFSLAFFPQNYPLSSYGLLASVALASVVREKMQPFFRPARKSGSRSKGIACALPYFRAALSCLVYLLLFLWKRKEAVQAALGYALGDALLWMLLRIAPAKTSETADGYGRGKSTACAPRMLKAAGSAFQFSLGPVLLAVSLSFGGAYDRFFHDLLALLLFIIPSALIARWLQKRLSEATDPGLSAAIGFFVCFLSVYAFLTLGVSSYAIACVSLTLVFLGAAIALTANASLSRWREAFPLGTAGNPDRRMGSYAYIWGRMAVLYALILLSCFNNSHGAFRELLPRIRPALLPLSVFPLLIASAAMIRFPLERRYFEKSSRFLALKKEGKENPALEKLLAEMEASENGRRFGLKLLAAIVRLFMPHRVIGAEAISQNDPYGAVFVCNHGTVYGPVAAYLHMPFFFRSWSSSPLLDKDQTAKHIYGMFYRLKWIPASLRMPLSFFFAPLTLWALNSLHSIPVYRDQPSKLRQTFRQSIAALQSGDNLLIFPEDSSKAPMGRYQNSGVGEFHTSFALLGELFCKATGANLRFIPVFADKKRRTLTFGRTVVFNPDIPQQQEIEHITRTLREEMLQIDANAAEAT